ncbi:MAG: hypothetical protein AAF663_05465, partial [Planctomycetota bacterium]
EAEDLKDYQKVILREMKKWPNISVFAFTATPKHKTLEVFGIPENQKPENSGGKISGGPATFHFYSMQQSIEEGFILDVLKHYTTYKTYFGLFALGPNDAVRFAFRWIAGDATRGLEHQSTGRHLDFCDHVDSCGWMDDGLDLHTAELSLLSNGTGQAVYGVSQQLADLSGNGDVKRMENLKSLAA